MALGARLRDSLGLEVQSIWSDDGIALHLPEADLPPPIADLLLTPDEIEELVVQEVGQTALFGARFRENAGRALLIPRRRPGQRTPLWQQRLKAQSLLQVARNYGSFPIVLETYRECLQDVFDLPALKRILRGLQTRELDLVEVETASASPFASSLLFAYVATYMYEDDTPAAERRAQALSLDRDLLRELLGQEELRDLLDPAAARRGRGAARRRPALARRAARSAADAAATCATTRSIAAHAAVLEAERRALRVRIAGEERLIAAEDAGLFRDALGVMPPGGLPEAFLEAGARCARASCSLASPARAGRSRPPRRRRATRLEPARVESLLAELERADRLVRGELRPGGTEREWCDPDVLRRLRRASLAALRKEVEPAEQAAFGRFLPAWHGIDRRATLREALVPLQALPLPVSLWESEVLRRRVPGYQPAWLDALCATGEVVWVGAGLDRVALYFRADAPLLGAPAGAPPPEGEAAQALRRRARHARPSSGPTCSPRPGSRRRRRCPRSWELVWAGEVTNDAWTPLRAARRYGTPVADRRPRRFSRTRAAGTTSTQGRWSLTSRLFPAAVDRRALAELLLERQGIVVRDGVRGEGIVGGYGAVYGELRALETIGSCRRGYFVEGLGGAQFALPGAVERLRELRTGAERRRARARRSRSGPAVRRGAAVAAAGRRSRGPGRRCARRPARRRGRALRRARRPHARAAARPDEAWLRPALAALARLGARGPREAPRGRALRRPPGRRDGGDAAARRGRVPRRAAPRAVLRGP